jgi:hypothetical protein
MAYGGGRDVDRVPRVQPAPAPQSPPNPPAATPAAGEQGPWGQRRDAPPGPWG